MDFGLFISLLGFAFVNEIDSNDKREISIQDYNLHLQNWKKKIMEQKQKFQQETEINNQDNIISKMISNCKIQAIEKADKLLEDIEQQRLNLRTVTTMQIPEDMKKHYFQFKNSLHIYIYPTLLLSRFLIASLVLARNIIDGLISKIMMLLKSLQLYIICIALFEFILMSISDSNLSTLENEKHSKVLKFFLRNIPFCVLMITFEHFLGAFLPKKEPKLSIQALKLKLQKCYRIILKHKQEFLQEMTNGGDIISKLIFKIGIQGIDKADKLLDGIEKQRANLQKILAMPTSNELILRDCFEFLKDLRKHYYVSLLFSRIKFDAIVVARDMLNDIYEVIFSFRLLIPYINARHYYPMGVLEPKFAVLFGKLREIIGDVAFKCLNVLQKIRSMFGLDKTEKQIKKLERCGVKNPKVLLRNLTKFTSLHRYTALLIGEILFMVLTLICSSQIDHTLLKRAFLWANIFSFFLWKALKMLIIRNSVYNTIIKYDTLIKEDSENGSRRIMVKDFNRCDKEMALILLNFMRLFLITEETKFELNNFIQDFGEIPFVENEATSSYSQEETSEIEESNEAEQIDGKFNVQQLLHNNQENTQEQVNEDDEHDDNHHDDVDDYENDHDADDDDHKDEEDDGNEDDVDHDEDEDYADDDDHHQNAEEDDEDHQNAKEDDVDYHYAEYDNSEDDSAVDEDDEDHQNAKEDDVDYYYAEYDSTEDDNSEDDGAVDDSSEDDSSEDDSSEDNSVEDDDNDNEDEDGKETPEEMCKKEFENSIENITMNSTLDETDEKKTENLSSDFEYVEDGSEIAKTLSTDSQDTNVEIKDDIADSSFEEISSSDDEDDCDDDKYVYFLCSECKVIKEYSENIHIGNLHETGFARMVCEGCNSSRNYISHEDEYLSDESTDHSDAPNVNETPSENNVEEVLSVSGDNGETQDSVEVLSSNDSFEDYVLVDRESLISEEDKELSNKEIVAQASFDQSDQHSCDVEGLNNDDSFDDYVLIEKEDVDQVSPGLIDQNSSANKY